MSSPPNTALVLVDPYNEFLHPDGKLHGMLEASIIEKNTVHHLKQLVLTARRQNIPVFYCLRQQVKPGFLIGWKHATDMQQAQLKNEAFAKGTFGVKIHEGLEPDLIAGDVIVSKHWSSSSFQNTDLDYQLRQREISHLVLAGLVANTCLESTARYAYEHGYHVTLITDATAAFSKAQADAATDLIWPMFAHKVIKTADWVGSL